MGSLSPPRPVVEVCDLVKDYRRAFSRRRFRAVDGVSLAAGPGEVLGLIGPNGGGKTTILKCLLGLLRPTSGVVRLFGLSPEEPEARARLGYLPEESPFPRVLNVEEALAFYACLAGIGRRERRVEVPRLIERVGLREARKRRIAELSKGMARRFGLAQALVGDPELIVLDEPTSGLDPLGTREFCALVAEERLRGRTVLFSSHRIADTERTCDRVALIHRGRLVAHGPIQAIAGADGLEAFFFRSIEGR